MTPLKTLIAMIQISIVSLTSSFNGLSAIIEFIAQYDQCLFIHITIIYAFYN